MFDEPSDETLAARIAANDLGAFGILYDRHAPRLHAWAAHVVGGDAADDAVQEIFVRVWRGARHFDPARGSFATWLGAVARHHLGAEAARRGRLRTVTAADGIDALLAQPSGVDVESLALAREEEHRVAHALANLPAEQRRVLVLAYFCGMTQSEMARALALPLGTVKKRVRLGMQKLRLALTDARAPARRLHAVVDE